MGVLFLGERPRREHFRERAFLPHVKVPMLVSPWNIRSKPWLLISAAWLGPAILAALREFVRARLQGQPVTWQSLVWEGGDWLLYAAFTPLVFLLSARCPLRQGQVWKTVPLHFLASLVFCAGWAIAGVALRSLLLGRSENDWFPSPLEWFLTSIPFGFAVYFAVLATEHAFRFLLESRQRETQAALLAAQLAEARLGALRMQLNPHFLFNSLNTILVMVRDGDHGSAADSIERLAGVLRRILRVDQEHEIPLADEIEFLEEYLAIEKARFSDRLRPHFDIARSLQRVAVPELILQPLVENALRHGIGKRTESGELTISARRDGDDLVLAVRDDGAGLPASGIEEGVGLSNTRERLATLYGEHAGLELSAGEPAGALAVIRLPFRELPAASLTLGNEQ
jgi:two-component system, LytTR family, sensor kinase